MVPQGYGKLGEFSFLRTSTCFSILLTFRWFIVLKFVHRSFGEKMVKVIRKKNLELGTFLPANLFGYQGENLKKGEGGGVI